MSLLFCFPNCGHMNRVTVHQECILLPLIQHLQDPFPGRFSQWLLVHVNPICRYTLIKPSLPLEGTLFSGPGHTGTWLIWFDVEATRSRSWGGQHHFERHLSQVNPLHICRQCRGGGESYQDEEKGFSPAGSVGCKILSCVLPNVSIQAQYCSPLLSGPQIQYRRICQDDEFRPFSMLS